MCIRDSSITIVISQQYSIYASRRRVLRILARPISSCLHHQENTNRKVRLSTVLVGTRPDLAAPRKGKMGGIGLSSGKNCTVGRLVGNPRQVNNMMVVGWW